jgi:hypothetical protein
MKQYNIGAIMFLLFVILILVLAATGCTTKHQPKGWVSITKAPMRVIVVDDEKDVDPDTIQMIMRYVGSQSYKEYYFNDHVGISTDYSANLNKNVSESRMFNLEVQ